MCTMVGYFFWILVLPIFLIGHILGALVRKKHEDLSPQLKEVQEKMEVLRKENKKLCAKLVKSKTKKKREKKSPETAPPEGGASSGLAG